MLNNIRYKLKTNTKVSPEHGNYSLNDHLVVQFRYREIQSDSEAQGKKQSKGRNMFTNAYTSSFFLLLFLSPKPRIQAEC